MLDDFYLRCRCPGIDGFETAHCLPQIVGRDAAVTALVREVRAVPPAGAGVYGAGGA